MNRVKRKKWLAIAIVIGCVAALLVYPFESTVVPEWEIRLVDESAKPVGNISITEGWANYSVESNRHEETRTADTQGYVSFPRRTVRASLLFRILGEAVVILNPHGQSGPRAFANVVGPYLSPTDAEYSPGKPLPQVIVVRPQR